MSSVLLDDFLGGSARQTSLGQRDSETRTGRTTPEILTRKPGSDGQQPSQISLTLSEIKFNQNYIDFNNIYIRIDYLLVSLLFVQLVDCLISSVARVPTSRVSEGVRPTT